MLLISLFNLLLAPSLSAKAAQPGVTLQDSAQAAPLWQDSGWSLPDKATPVCFDPTQPHRLIFNQDDTSFSIDFLTGQSVKISSHTITACADEAGLLFNSQDGAQTTLRLGYNGFSEKVIQYPYRALVIAKDGSNQIYALNASPGKLYYSADGGTSWQERGQQFGGNILSVATAANNAQVVYAVVQGDALPPIQTPGSPLIHHKFSIWASANAGQSWEKRYDGQEGTGGDGPCYGDPARPTLQTLPGRATPTDEVILNLSSGCSPSSYSTEYNYSTDGGRHFTLLRDSKGTAVVTSRDSSATLQHISQGLVINWDGSPADFSSDGAKSWQKINLPDLSTSPDSSNDGLTFIPSPNIPGVLLSGQYGSGTSSSYVIKGFWYSTDQGKSWQKAGSNLEIDPGYNQLLLSSYTPTSLVAVQPKTNKIYTLDLSVLDKTQTAAAMPSQTPSNNYYVATHHNISPLFAQYWQAKGGLAQFGYPQTEVLREVNPADGKVYMVQYFERNRFEYHPEKAGTDYEVLLGLLGNEQTTARRAKDDPAFRRVANPNQSAFLYFDATGHTLSHTFRDYWEQHGGLAVYGYPISEEFDELNPDDGKVYTVQYFERNRFEYHQENKGTPYEVLLGLLGNTLLKQKGWL